MHATPQSGPKLRRRGVVAVVVREERFLVIRRSATVAAPRKFCFPGGGIDGRESEEEALVREFQEELNGVIRPVRRLWQSTTQWQVDLAWWLGEVDESVPLVANAEEVESIHWLNGVQMLELPELLESNREFLGEIAQGTIKLP